MQILPIKQLKPYFKIAEEEAHKSPCTRRQYGAIIIKYAEGEFPTSVVANNSRESGCCDNYCARTKFYNGERVEVGAEVHAETAALIAYGQRTSQNVVMGLVGFAGGHELLSTAVYPCHTCALNLRYAGFKHIFIRDNFRNITPFSIAEIIEYREEEWLSA